MMELEIKELILSFQKLSALYLIQRKKNMLGHKIQ